MLSIRRQGDTRWRVMPYCAGRRLHTRPKGVITCQSFGLDKKLSNPIGLLNFLEVTVGFEPTDNGVADRGLTTWLRHHTIILFEHSLFVNKTTSSIIEDVEIWSGLRGSNPPPQPWQGCALPNELNPHI